MAAIMERTCHCIFACVVIILTSQKCCTAKRFTNLATDKSSLLSLKAHISSDPYLTITQNWRNSSSVCSWIGVTCSTRHHRVTALNVSNMGLSGSIPPQLGNLSFLVSLDLRSNNFSGTLPQELSRLRRLKHISVRVNNFRGEIPSFLPLLPKLEFLSLRKNSFTGSIPKSISNLTNLYHLDFSENSLEGSIPQELSNLQKLQKFGVQRNHLSGIVPSTLFNISSLQVLALTYNFLSGNLPNDMCRGFPFIEELYFGSNRFGGRIPESISNCSQLTVLGLSLNKFTGLVPHSLGNLRFLEKLGLGANNLTIRSSSSEVSLITSLTNCRSLIYLDISGNRLDGTLPRSVGNLSSQLQFLSALSCGIKGRIPAELGNLTNLIDLSFSSNHMSGNIPPTVKHLSNLQGLYLGENIMSGSIPDGLCDLHRLSDMNLGRNRLSGQIPNCLGNVTTLRYLDLYSNILTSGIPPGLWRLKDLLMLDLSGNSLTGFLPLEIGNLVGAIHINLSMNQLSKSIPSTIGSLQNLIELSLAHNKLEGSVPKSIGSMISLETLDFSYNNLSGSLPKSLLTLQYLDNFNVSFNSLSGEIPSGGPFMNFTMESFKGNEGLCGIPRFHVPPCHVVVNKHRSKTKKVEFVLFIPAGVVALATILCLGFIFLIYIRKQKAPCGTNGNLWFLPERISYYELSRATEEFNESNLLGMGSFGSVYRGILGNGDVVAIKVFKLQSEAGLRSFDVECEVLRNIRHRNLTKVINSCSNEEFKALVLEYMPKGNLEKWLYSHNYRLDFIQRLNIMIDVASALEYLHHGYSSPIVHCDLKPSNILLDEEMVAHVSDFGISKLLSEGQSGVITNTLATLGYIAPEYGLEGLVSTRCDVYSYGVMLMETFTRRKPSDDMFVGDLSLKVWVESSVPQSTCQVIDANLLMSLDDEHGDKIVELTSSVLELGFKCSAEAPSDRINMKEALAELQKIKRRFCNEV